MHALAQRRLLFVIVIAFKVPLGRLVLILILLQLMLPDSQLVASMTSVMPQVTLHHQLVLFHHLCIVAHDR